MRSFFAVVAILVFAQGCYIPSGGDTPAPVPSPVVPVNPATPVVTDDWQFTTTLPPAFAGKPQLAVNVAETCRVFADQLGFDGKQDEPQVLSSTDLKELFAAIMTYDLLGGDPALSPFASVIGTAIESEFEADGEEIDLTPVHRKRAIQMFRAASQALRGGR